MPHTGTLTAAGVVGSGVALRRHTYAWRAIDGSLDVGIELDAVLDRVVTIPDINRVPTTLYDVTIEDQHGADILLGLCANRSATAVETVWIADDIETVRGAIIGSRGPLRFKVANAGPGNQGLVVVYAFHAA